MAHPALVTVAKEIFDEHMKTQNQIHIARGDVQKGAADLLQVSAFYSPSALRRLVFCLFLAGHS